MDKDSLKKTATKHGNALAKIMGDLPQGIHMVTFMFGDTGPDNYRCVVVGNCQADVSAKVVRDWLARVEAGVDGDPIP